MKRNFALFVVGYLLSYGLLSGTGQEPEIQVDLVYETRIEGAGTAVAWHPTENYFVASADSTIYFFDPAQSEPFREITFPAPEVSFPLVAIGGLEWSPDGTRLAILWGGDVETIQYTVWLLDVASGEVSLTINAEAIRSIHWSPNGTLLAGIQINLIDVEQGPEESTFTIWDALSSLKICKS